MNNDARNFAAGFLTATCLCTAIGFYGAAVLFSSPPSSPGKSKATITRPIIPPMHVPSVPYTHPNPKGIYDI
jgi:hypothetical protein